MYIAVPKGLIGQRMICMKEKMVNLKEQVNCCASMSLTLVKELGLFCMVLHCIEESGWRVTNDVIVYMDSFLYIKLMGSVMALYASLVVFLTIDGI